MAMIELVDYNETYKLEAGAKKATTRRSRRGKSTTAEPVAETNTNEEE
jgi:large subunit ribosomal protein L17